jgi:hypothetical protein
MILETQSTAGAVPIISQLTESTNFCSTDQANIPRKKIFTKIEKSLQRAASNSVDRLSESNIKLRCQTIE